MDKEKLRWYHYKYILGCKNSWKCEICKCNLENESHHLHHKTYNNVGFDAEQEDLMFLCASCHGKLHWEIKKENLQKNEPREEGVIPSPSP